VKELLSVIIPVYNVEEYIVRCLDSVLNQTYKSIEVIIVDDGSGDFSGSICDRYAQRDTSIKVLHKANAGVSSARNIGLLQVQGSYITFVDSDDYLDKNTYAELLNKLCMVNADILIYDAFTVYNDVKIRIDTIGQLTKDTVLKKEEISPSLLVEIAGAVWRCIYKTDLLLKNNITFPISVPFSEDRVFNILSFGFSSLITYVKKAYYYRYMRKGSIVNCYYHNMIDIIIEARKLTQDAIDLAWNKCVEFKHVYDKQMEDMIVLSIRNVFNYNLKSPLIQKLKLLRVICNNHFVRSLFIKSNSKHIIRFLVIFRCYIILFILTMFSTIRNRTSIID